MLTKRIIEELKERTQDIYIHDDIPWVVGYSGGKDSTAALQLVWYSLQELPERERMRKPVYVISTDTQVEQPLVANWVNRSHELMRAAAEEQRMPIRPTRLLPDVGKSYWVNLIGRGYPLPRPLFRWCTSRLKIEPSNRFILDVVKTFGETILVLGTRRAESSRRAGNMALYESKRTRKWLSPNGSLPNSYVYTPLEDWTTDDVWLFLMQYENPWGCSNKDLLTMYRGATADGECPLVLDTSTPSCGNSRFGCWVCTLVSQDKSMEAMIANDEEKAWMTPLLELRNEIASVDEKGKINDRSHRDYRRMDGTIKLKGGRAVPGPYVKEWREYILRRLLTVQVEVRRTAPPELRDITLITHDQLREIRRIWVVEKHEFDDSLPRIYESATGRPYPHTDELATKPFGREEWQILEEMTGSNHVRRELLASILNIEQRHGTALSKRSVTQQLETVLRRCFYESEQDAVEYQKRRDAIKSGPKQQSLYEYDDLPEEDLTANDNPSD